MDSTKGKPPLRRTAKKISAVTTLLKRLPVTSTCSGGCLVTPPAGYWNDLVPPFSSPQSQTETGARRS